MLSTANHQKFPEIAQYMVTRWGLHFVAQCHPFHQMVCCFLYVQLGKENRSFSVLTKYISISLNGHESLSTLLIVFHWAINIRNYFYHAGSGTSTSFGTFVFCFLHLQTKPYIHLSSCVLHSVQLAPYQHFCIIMQMPILITDTFQVSYIMLKPYIVLYIFIFDRPQYSLILSLTFCIHCTVAVSMMDFY